MTAARMRYHVLAVDYDGTLARHGKVDEETLAALQRLKASGRRLVMVTGRQQQDLENTFAHTALFDLLVLENGAVLHSPATRETTVLCAPPDARFVAELERRGVTGVAVGHAVVATWEPHRQAVVEAIHDLGLDLQVIFNKTAVMVLPSGVNKGTGLAAALSRLGLSPHNAVGVGDAENDHPLLALCECGVAVSNAIPALAERADLVTPGERGRGVVELVDELLTSDLAAVAARLSRHDLRLGTTPDGSTVSLPAHGQSVLLVGTSGAGKSTVAKGLLERIAEHGYQFCVIDPEGDYTRVLGAVTLGDTSHAPSPDEVLGLLADPRTNGVVNLLGVKLADRPAFFDGLMARLAEMRARVGRPHWTIVDEAHHLMPARWAAPPVAAGGLKNLLMVTVHPDRVSAAALEAVDVVLALGQDPSGMLATFARMRGLEPPARAQAALADGEVLAWWPGRPVLHVRTIPPEFAHTRHIRKYATGEVPPEENFVFTGAEGKFRLRVQNLSLFVQIAQGIDDDTWLFHLRRRDYSDWFRRVIKDDDLAAEAASVEERATDAESSREAIVSAIERRYTAPA